MSPEETTDLIELLKKLQMSNKRLIELIEEHRAVFENLEQNQIENNKKQLS